MQENNNLTGKGKTPSSRGEGCLVGTCQCDNTEFWEELLTNVLVEGSSLKWIDGIRNAIASFSLHNNGPYIRKFSSLAKIIEVHLLALSKLYQESQQLKLVWSNIVRNWRWTRRIGNMGSNQGHNKEKRAIHKMKWKLHTCIQGHNRKVTLARAGGPWSYRIRKLGTSTSNTEAEVFFAGNNYGEQTCSTVL